MSGSASANRPERPSDRGRLFRRTAVLVVALVVTGALVYAGVRDRGGRQAAAEPTPTATATPLASLDLSALPIPRGSFCAVLEQDDVEAALGGPVSRTAHYDSGDRARLAAGVTDIAHEYNCGYVSASGTQARAWVFAEPVTTEVALGLAREAAGREGCAPVADGPRFGTPSVGTRCRTGRPVASVVTLSGLFGDTWLSCQLSTPRASGAAGTVRRAEQWCVRVATSLSARP
jgi:hypothetical protein